MKHAILCVLLLLLVLSVGAQEREAESPPAPLIFFADELILMDEASGEVEVWTDCAPDYMPRVSPNGEWLALLSADYDLRLCNLITREVHTVAVLPDTAMSRPHSQVAWSPDSDRVAWLVADTDGFYVAGYDVDADEITVLIDDVGGYPQQVMWGQTGLLVVAQLDGSEAATLYSTDGDVLFEDLTGGISFGQFFWVTDAEGKEYLGIYSDFWRGSIIDLESGIPYLAEGIELYSLLAPEEPTISLHNEAFDWVVDMPDGEPLYLLSLGMSFSGFVPQPAFDPRNVAIAPDGQAFVIFDLARALWRDGTFTDLPDVLPRQDGAGVIWGPLAYRVRGEVVSGQG